MGLLWMCNRGKATQTKNTSKMADSAHLEKMGRELKCPICLSLLNSAVSLTCNHVFCNLCIMESMKSDSHCPVCKVPYRRREVRAAPHMDTLVSIYKSMEVASGINMFVTQTTPVKTSAGKSQAEGERGSGRPETISHGKQKKRGTFKGEGLKELVKTNVETSDPNSKPSFPAKKRVHVPQCLLPGTRPHPEQCEGLKDGSIVLKEKPNFNEMGEPVLSPFFWLREEDDNDDVERLSCQRTQEDLFMDTTPPNAPCFSDIKDSDDESPTKMTPISQSKVANIFDSEMFEWTQRACSPELCSTPVKSQVAYQDKLNRINDDKCEISSQIWTASNGEEHHAESANANMGSLSSLKTKKAKAQSGRKKLNRRDKRINGRSQKKHVKLSMDEVPIDSSKIDPNLGKKTCNRNKRAIFDMIDVNKETKHAISKPIEEKIHNQGNEIIRTVWPDLSCENLENVDKRQLKTIRSIKKIIGNQKSHCKEAPKHENQGNENVTKAGKAFNLENKSSNLGKKFDIPVSKKCKRLKSSSDDCAKNVPVDKSLVEASKPSANEAQTITGLQKDLMIRCTDNLEITKKVLSVAKDRFLQKCESFPGKIKCAFCQSSVNSEASGEMMHYVNGRPVAPDYNEGSNIVHSHKNCTEWAPNVYFEDDIAINLETELARSRRIRCSCCGIKGAALGCYEKSCRKSFHVPCAKLVRQCRWDTENFVMLCPLHTSMKFPKEIAGFEGKRRKNSVPKGESQAKKAEVMKQHVSESGLWKWPGSPNKWVICSSGLTVAEKVIVSEFSKMAGVLMSPTFGPNVTHVIASTDENGACKRTLKFLMGILEGKWILKIDWVKACMKAMEPVAEEQYEISVDIHGIKDGPRLGRLRVLSKQPKLFNGYKFYFMGEFIPSYKGYLQDLVVAAGGTVLQRKPISEDFFGSSAMSTFIIYNLELTEDCDSRKKTICKCRQDDAEALASSTGAKVTGHSWVLDSIAASKLQNLIK